MLKFWAKSVKVGAVLDILNSAANEIEETISVDGYSEAVSDAMNILVNVVTQRLYDAGISLGDAIRAAYDEEPETVLDWISA